MVHQFCPSIVLVYALIGALVGYVTNLVAVKLLFYPERPIGFWRLKIQGVIPARKKDIAARIASLLSDARVRRALHSSLLESMERGAIRSAIERLVRERIDGFISSLPPIIAPMINGKWLSAQLAELLSRVLASNPRMLEVLVEEAVSSMEVERHVLATLETLSSRDIEEMFRSLAGRELKFIELSGALLGAIIGALNGLIVEILGF